MLHARHAQQRAGRRARRRRPDRLQPQPRHLAGVLRPHHHDAHLRRSTADAGARAPRRASPSAAAASSAWARIGGVRCRLLQQLATLDPHPESVPVNLLVRVEGTPLADVPPEDPLELVRTIATARILMPASFVRLSAGPAGADRRGAGAVLPGRRQLDLPRRSAADHAQSRPDPRRSSYWPARHAPDAGTGRHGECRLTEAGFASPSASGSCSRSSSGTSSSIACWCRRAQIRLRSPPWLRRSRRRTCSPSPWMRAAQSRAPLVRHRGRRCGADDWLRGHCHRRSTER